MAVNKLEVKKEGPVTIITFNRPESYNTINYQMGEELLVALSACEKDEGVRAVVLTGKGEAFCAGGDVKEMGQTLDRDPTYFFKRLTLTFHAAVSTITRMPKPVIAAVNGVAAGAGFSLMLACDMALASEKARFTMAYTKIGLVPDGGSTYFLSRTIGLRKALELVYTNRVLSAQEAEALGLVNQVVAEKDFSNSVMSLAFDLAQGPTMAFGRAKELIHRGWRESLETQMENERQIIALCGASPDGREGIKAFIEKRKPTFVGR